MEVLTLATPSDVVTVAGNGTACVALFQSGQVKPGQRTFWNSGCASMGYDLPAALGAASTGRKTVCIAGDGSIQMNLAELQTVLNHKLPVKIFLLENNGYASIRQTQNAFFRGAKIGCDRDSGVMLPDMLKLAQAFGFRTSEIKQHSGLREAVENVLMDDDPAFCVVRLGDNEFAPKLSSRTQADGVIASSSLEDMAPFLPEERVKDNLITG
jgi:acetolactate synthase-1/2/3 large subunit